MSNEYANENARTPQAQIDRLAWIFNISREEFGDDIVEGMLTRHKQWRSLLDDAYRELNEVRDGVKSLDEFLHTAAEGRTPGETVFGAAIRVIRTYIAANRSADREIERLRAEVTKSQKATDAIGERLETVLATRRHMSRQIDALKDECARLAGEAGRLRANVAILSVDKVDPVAEGLAFYTIKANAADLASFGAPRINTPPAAAAEYSGPRVVRQYGEPFEACVPNTSGHVFRRTTSYPWPHSPQNRVVTWDCKFCAVRLADVPPGVNPNDPKA